MVGVLVVVIGCVVVEVGLWMTDCGDGGQWLGGCWSLDVDHVEDVELMVDLGLNSYRFSISWARILPKGRHGNINLAGIRFYDKLIDNLLEKGIQPFITLSHFDIPQDLEDRYGGLLSNKFQVKYWVTFNEPNVNIHFGYRTGVYPPNRCSGSFGNCSKGDSEKEPFIAAHNVILAHAVAVKLYRTRYQEKQGGTIGIVLNTIWYEPISNSTSDKFAAERAQSFFMNWFLDPIMFGEYPAEMRKILGRNLPRFTKNEKKILIKALDFIGVNHYTSFYAQDCIFSSCKLGGGVTWTEGLYLRTPLEQWHTHWRTIGAHYRPLLPPHFRSPSYRPQRSTAVSGWSDLIVVMVVGLVMAVRLVMGGSQGSRWMCRMMCGWGGYGVVMGRWWRVKGGSGWVVVVEGGSGQGGGGELGLAVVLNNITYTSFPQTAMDWLYIHPQGMEKIVTYLKKRYSNTPMFITENGYAQESLQNSSINGLLNDSKRVEYMADYLDSLLRTIEKGADVRGYFAWSLLDNFEWLWGYTRRFGLYYVDYDTLKRSPKLSVAWYREFISKHRRQTVANQRGNEIALQSS
ncbi:Beta-glucosidase 47 [Bienertia sinuspersici]